MTTEIEEQELLSLSFEWMQSDFGGTYGLTIDDRFVFLVDRPAFVWYLTIKDLNAKNPRARGILDIRITDVEHLKKLIDCFS